ncbi:MAG: hypothetical protein K2N34_14740 [Lachnospiraceae bacterium]|nr:hypothetical protein [Lachnospiraceae bacterium]
MSNKKETQEEVIIVNNAGELYNLIKTKTYNKFELVQPIMFKGTKVQTINNTQPA